MTNSITHFHETTEGPEPLSSPENAVQGNPEKSKGKSHSQLQSNVGKVRYGLGKIVNFVGSSGAKIKRCPTKAQEEEEETLHSELASAGSPSRLAAAQCLEKVNELFVTETYACKPSSLPQSQPSKDITAKLEDEEASRTSFFNLPEGSIFSILSFTSPCDVCRSSAISRAFQLAAASDRVWEGFLPSEYEEILSRASCRVPFSSKKELYFHFCNSILIDNGRKIFSLDRSTGKKCYTLCARELEITWVHDRRYWSWVSLPESRFSQVAKLREVWFLYIAGKIDICMLSPKTTYAAYLILRYEDEWVGLDVRPADVTVEVGSHVSSSKSLLYQDTELMKLWSPVRVPMQRKDGWMEIELGEFFNNGGDGELRMCLKEPNDATPKGGLIIEGIEVRPKKKPN